MRLAAVLVLAALFVATDSIEGRASVRGFDGTLTIQIGVLDPISIPGIGTAVVNGSSGGGPLTALDVPGGVFASYYVLPVTDPSAAPIKGIQASLANGPGAFTRAGVPGHLAGSMSLQGVSKVCLFGPCSSAVANIEVPLGVVGVGGAAFVTAAVNLTVAGAPWTTATAVVGSITRMGGISQAASGTRVRLVTPVFVSTNIGPSAVVPTWGILDPHLAVPEPATLVLLGSGIACLVAVGRTRAR